jgi:Zn-dependent protease
LSWSLRILRIHGIDIRVHLTFALVLVWAALVWGAETGQGLRGALFGIVATLLLFAAVIAHELAHAAVALHYGVPVRDITLWPMGGIASMEREPDKPSEALLIAAAGPLASILVAVAIWLVGTALQAGGLLEPDWIYGALGDVSWSGLFVYLVAANLGVAAFNLIPALPLDGGRVLRAVLAMFMEPIDATRWAVRLAHLLAWLMGLVGVLVGNLFLIVIAFLVYGASGVEGAAAEAKSDLETMRVGQAMVRGVVTLGPAEPLSRAVQLTLQSNQGDFPIVEAGRLVGLLTARDLWAGLDRFGARVPIAGVMRTDVPTLAPDDSLFDAQQRMAAAHAGALIVLDGDQVAGLLTIRHLVEVRQLLARDCDTPRAA